MLLTHTVVGYNWNYKNICENKQLCRDSIACNKTGNGMNKRCLLSLTKSNYRGGREVC